MKKLIVLLFTFSMFISSYADSDNISRGYLVIIGGGDRPVYLSQKMIDLAGGPGAKFAIIPMASSVPIESANYQVEELKKLGIKNIITIICDSVSAESDSVLAKIKDANAIYFTGGDQSRLTKALLGTKLLEEIKKIYLAGGVIGGTSAGAAVMSRIMITGDELLNSDSSRSFIEIKKGNIKTTEGFGFVNLAVIDQHFIIRKRHNRLISIILENPNLVGIGIDESTSIIVNPDDTFEVLGEREVIVYDASESKNISINKLGLISGTNLKMHILSNADKYDMVNKKVLE